MSSIPAQGNNVTRQRAANGGNQPPNTQHRQNPHHYGENTEDIGNASTLPQAATTPHESSVEDGKICQDTNLQENRDDPNVDRGSERSSSARSSPLAGRERRERINSQLRQGNNSGLSIPNQGRNAPTVTFHEDGGFVQNPLGLNAGADHLESSPAPTIRPIGLTDDDRLMIANVLAEIEDAEIQVSESRSGRN